MGTGGRQLVDGKRELASYITTMTRIIAAAIFSIAFVALPATAEPPGAGGHRPLNQWVVELENSLKDYLLDGGKIVSSSALMWPDGRPSLIVYVVKGKETIRCVDWYNRDFTSNGFMCYRLIALKKPFRP